MSEKEYIRKRFGKWSSPNVPHKGWVCVDIEDLEEPSFECEMCESQTIRYVHYMKHKDYKDVLKVGCVCAEKMEGHYSRARVRDDFMKKRSTKRVRWIDNSRWKTSKKGNDFIITDGYVIVMKKQNGYWSALIESEDKNFKIWSQRKYKSIDEAKLAAFDYLTKILAEKEIKREDESDS